MLISCTKKLADALEIEVSEVVPMQRDPLYEWHAKIFAYQRQTGVILMNNQTRYSVVLYRLTKEHLQMLNKLLLFAIEMTFYAEGFSEFVIARYMRRGGEANFIKCFDRSILSQMNYVQYHLDRWMEKQQPTCGIYMIELSIELNRLPMEKHLYNRYPIEVLREEMLEV